MKKLKRYHHNIYYPDWAEESLSEFVRSIRAGNSITFSIHSVDKIVSETLEYGRQLFKFLLKAIKRTSLEADTIFEFYAFGEEVKKACFRFSFEAFPVDIILVISADGTVITIFTANKGDNHSTLNARLYERR
jgi:hypothetical protein